ncbi:hypothetical protein [Longimycelium tulufanense]|uniref:hypothetical protein n=1 Tax=Longimycelium tulufanense TaxID=907463 RepID=UPI001666A332|nr:hypothetical protein [Longimycelium tulufanense]
METAPRIMCRDHVATSARVRWGECDSQGYACPASFVIRTWAGTSTVRLECYHEIYRGNGAQLIAEARSSRALVDPWRRPRIRTPQDFRDKFETFMENRRRGETTSTP